MNCPHHALVYRSSGRSYRDLPLRLAELGAMYRAERSGVVGGLSRVRAMTLNDGHIFCAPEQIPDEVAAVLAMVRRAYEALGLTVGRFRLSLRGSGGKYAGDEARWERAEGVLRGALDGLGLRYEEERGEAAFYGPKLDVQVRDALGHEETLSTVQVDFLLPQRLGLTYTGSDGRSRVPALVHRSVVSTMERMVAHLIERHAGAFPPWLAPVQVAVLPVGAGGARYAAVAGDRFAAAGLRVELHGAERSLGARIRAVRSARVPYLAVIGAREAEAGHVALRLRDGRQRSAVPLDEAVAGIADVVRRRSATLELSENDVAACRSGRPPVDA